MNPVRGIHAAQIRHKDLARNLPGLQSGATEGGADAPMIAALDAKEELMAITFRVDSTTGEGTFIRVLRDGRPFGKILEVTTKS